MAKNALKSPDYGFDGSPFAIGIVCLVGLSFFGGGVLLLTHPSVSLKITAAILMLLGLLLTLVCGSYLYYVKRGKLRRRDKMLSMIIWQGSENVLDIGTGRGLLMIGAAQKLTTGKSVGIDIWNSGDMHDNTDQNTMKNAEVAGVRERVEVRNEDVRTLSFSNNTFDVVLSNLCLHNIPTQSGREKACREIARVLKPNGIVVIADKLHIKEYGSVFAKEGLKVDFPRAFYDGSLCRLVKAVKGGS